MKKKLNFNKETIAQLDLHELNNVGGEFTTNLPTASTCSCVSCIPGCYTTYACPEPTRDTCPCPITTNDSVQTTCC
ncbi:MAG: class I lanthipeptide [Hyphomicrobiales bacterium]